MVSFIKSLLLIDEKVVYRAKPSIILQIFSIIIFIIATLFTTFLIRKIPTEKSSLPSFVNINTLIIDIIIIILIFANLVFILGVLSFYYFTDYIITNKRIICKKGIIKISILDIILSNVEAVYVSQNIIERLFNFGSVIIIGTGGTKQKIDNVMRPFIFKKHIDEVLYEKNI